MQVSAVETLQGIAHGPGSTERVQKPCSSRINSMAHVGPTWGPHGRGGMHRQLLSLARRDRRGRGRSPCNNCFQPAHAQGGSHGPGGAALGCGARRDGRSGGAAARRRGGERARRARVQRRARGRAVRADRVPAPPRAALGHRRGLVRRCTAGGALCAQAQLLLPQGCACSKTLVSV